MRAGAFLMAAMIALPFTPPFATCNLASLLTPDSIQAIAMLAQSPSPVIRTSRAATSPESAPSIVIEEELNGVAISADAATSLHQITTARIDTPAKPVGVRQHLLQRTSLRV